MGKTKLVSNDIQKYSKQKNPAHSFFFSTFISHCEKKIINSPVSSIFKWIILQSRGAPGLLLMLFQIKVFKSPSELSLSPIPLGDIHKESLHLHEMCPGWLAGRSEDTHSWSKEAHSVFLLSEIKVTSWATVKGMGTSLKDRNDFESWKPGIRTDRGNR